MNEENKMKLNKIGISFSLIYFSLSAFSEQLPTNVKISIQNWPPYNYLDKEGKVVGVSSEILDCSFKQLNIPLDIEVVPWKRAQDHTRTGISHGFSGASRNAKRDLYATRTIDISPQKWVWYTLKGRNIQPNDTKLKTDLSIAGLRGSNIVNWLKKQGYKNVFETNDLDNMLAMVETQRVDAFMMNQLVAETRISDINRLKAFEVTQYRSMPVGVYFSNEFLKKYPKFLTKINEAISQCKK